MTKKTSLREIEKKTYMSYHQDGLIDLFVGIYVLFFGLGIFLRSVVDFSTWFVIPGIFPAIMVPIWISVKKQITMPRIGYVKFRSGGANKLTAVFIGLIVVGLGVTTLAWASVLRDIIVSYSFIIIGIGAASISSLFAYTLGLNRLYAYGLLSLVLFITGDFITIPFEYSLLTIGLVIILNGLVLLTRFIKRYPLTQGEKPNARESF